MGLFVTALEREVAKLHANGVRMRIVGDRARFAPSCAAHDRRRERTTARQHAPHAVNVAFNYGGRWDIVQAAAKLVAGTAARRGDLDEERCRAHWRWPTRPSPTSSSAPAASSASAISCCGSSPTPSCISPTACGRISTPPRSTRAHRRSTRERERRFGRTSAQLEPNADGERLIAC